MRVLLTADAERANANTILMVPGSVETVRAPLLPSIEHRGIRREEYVAEVEPAVVARAIATARDHRHPIAGSARLSDELSRMHRRLRPYVIGSRIRLEVTRHGRARDRSRAVLTMEAYARGGPRDEGVQPVQPPRRRVTVAMSTISGEASDRRPPGWHVPSALRPRERGFLTSDIRLRLAPRARLRALPGVVNRPPLKGGSQCRTSTSW